MLRNDGNPESSANSRVAETITSRDNRWLKRFRTALAGESRPAARDRMQAPGDNLIGIEGARMVETALRSGLETIALLLSESGCRHLPSLAPLIPSSARVLSTPDRLFAQISGTESPQGVAALVKPHASTFDDLVRGLPLVLVLAGIQDPGNVGTLVRTAEAFGATGIAACHAGAAGTADPHGPKALRASAGSALRIPVLRGMSAPVVLAQLRIAGVRIYAAAPNGYIPDRESRSASAGDANPTGERDARDAGPVPKAEVPWEADWRGPSALLLGNEGAGLQAELLRSADALVSIPQIAAWQPGAPMDSLNVAIAGSILLYEAARQRGFA
jgi:TrmH family RNA methyltransferase